MKKLAKNIVPGDRVVSAAGHECLVVRASRQRHPQDRTVRGVFLAYEAKNDNNEDCVIETFLPLRFAIDVVS